MICGATAGAEKIKAQQSRRPPTLVDGKQLAAVLRIKPLWRLHCCAACFLLRGRRTDPDPPELNKTKRKAPETVPRGYEGSEETRLASQPARATIIERSDSAKTPNTAVISDIEAFANFTGVVSIAASLASLAKHRGPSRC